MRLRITRWRMACGGRRWWAERSWAGWDKEAGEESAEANPLDAIRARAFDPLLALDQALELAAGGEKSELTAVGFVDAVCQFLVALNCPGKIGEWASQERLVGRLHLAEEHEQVWQAVMELLEQMRIALGGEAMGLDDFSEVLEAGLSGLTLGLVPPALDQVLVGTVARSRQPELRTVFVLGMNDDQFPKAGGPDQILSDSEREILIGRGLELSPTSVVRHFRERYLLYVALTRGARRLWISWAAATEEGKALRPSPFLSVIEECARGEFLRVRLSSDWLRNSLEAVELPSQAIEGVVGAAAKGEDGGGDAEWFSLGERLKDLKDFSGPLRDALRSVSALNVARVDASRVGRLFDARSAVSVSRLESFAKCPFNYFAGYALSLREREEFEIQPLEIGNFHHQVLNEVFQILSARVGQSLPDWAPRAMGKWALDWGKVSLAQAEEALDEAIEIHREAFLTDGPLQETQTRFFVSRSRRVLLSALRSFIQQGAQDSFIQISSELEFGFGDSSLPALKIAAANGKEIALRGKVDRVDAARGEDGFVFLRVVDFKSSVKTLSLVETLNGLALQLPIYMAALLQGVGENDLRPAGIFFLPVFHELQTSDAPGEGDVAENVLRARGAVEEKAIRLFGPLEPGGQSAFIAVKMKKDGEWGDIERGDWLPSGVLESFCRRACAEAANLSGGILAGRIDIRPYRKGNERPCTYCEYGDLCRVGPQHGDYRVIKGMKRREVVEILQGK